MSLPVGLTTVFTARRYA